MSMRSSCISYLSIAFLLLLPFSREAIGQTVNCNLAPNAALGSAITAIDKVQQDMHMPPSLQADFQGTAASFKNSLSNEALLIPAGLKHSPLAIEDLSTVLIVNAKGFKTNYLDAISDADAGYSETDV